MQETEANIQETRRSMRLIREQLVELEALRSDHHKSSKTYTKINGMMGQLEKEQERLALIVRAHVNKTIRQTLNAIRENSLPIVRLNFEL